MGAVYEDVFLSWEGHEYKVTPTYRMVQEIEQRVSILGVSARIARGDPPLSLMSEIIATMLRAAGCKVTAEEVYTELMTGDDLAAITHLSTLIITAFIPQKKPDSPTAAAVGGTPAPEPPATG